MATDSNDIVKQGYLKCKSRSLGLWKKNWIILRRVSNKGPCRIEKYVDESAARNQEQYKVQLLGNVSAVVRISIKQRKHAFSIEFHDGFCKYFSCESDLEADNWVKLVTQECLFFTSDISNGEPDILKPGIQKELQEQFKVYLMPTTKLDVFGECLLQVTHENIYIWDAINNKSKLCVWPLTALRRYGSDLTKFTFEAGRHCVTGEGMFIFHTLEGEKIYRKVHQATLAIADAHQQMKKHSSTASLPFNYSDSQSNNSLESSKFSNFINKNFEHQVMETSKDQRNSWYSSDNESDSLPISSSLSQVYNKNSQNHLKN